MFSFIFFVVVSKYSSRIYIQVPELESEYEIRCGSIKDDFQRSVNALVSKDDGDLEYIV